MTGKMSKSFDRVLRVMVTEALSENWHFSNRICNIVTKAAAFQSIAIYEDITEMRMLLCHNISGYLCLTGLTNLRNKAQ